MKNIKTIALEKKYLLVIAQFATLLGVSILAPLFHVQLITGPIVNAALFLGAILLPVEYALLLCLLPSIVALSVGTLPVALAPMLPFIMLSNAILVIAFKGNKLLLEKIKKHLGIFSFFFSVVLASFLKFVFLFSTSYIVVRLIAQKPVATKAAAMMGLPQLITALAGGILTFMILKALKKYDWRF